jgi:hypothetical protein
LSGIHPAGAYAPANILNATRRGMFIAAANSAS